MISQIKVVRADSLTCKPLLNPFCRDGKGSKNLDHYLYDQLHHPIRQSHFSIHLETFEKIFNPREDVSEHFLARINIRSCLRDIRVIIVCTHQRNHVL